MRIHLTPILVLALSLTLAPAILAQNQQPSPDRRQVVHRVTPQYPDVARRIGLSGTVRAVAQVGSDGKVRKVEVVGGSPLLVQAAESAIAQWRYAPGAETQEIVELRFTP